MTSLCAWVTTLISRPEIPAWLQAFAAIAGIALSTALLVVAFLQWRVYRRQASIMEKQSELIANQAIVSKQTQRAFVFVKEIDVVFDRVPSTMSAYGTPILGRIQSWRLTPIWENSGDTPAKCMIVNFNCQEFAGRLEPDSKGNYRASRLMAIWMEARRTKA